MATWGILAESSQRHVVYVLMEGDRFPYHYFAEKVRKITNEPPPLQRAEEEQCHVKLMCCIHMSPFWIIAEGELDGADHEISVNLCVVVIPGEMRLADI